MNKRTHFQNQKNHPKSFYSMNYEQRITNWRSQKRTQSNPIDTQCHPGPRAGVQSDTIWMPDQCPPMTVSQSIPGLIICVHLRAFAVPFGSTWRHLGALWRPFGAVWCSFGQTWRRFGLLLEHKYPQKPRFKC